MPSATIINSSTPVSIASSLANNQNATAVQSGPYTKAQCKRFIRLLLILMKFHFFLVQSTMEGSRSIKNGKEIEQLLGDYPAALELYRTGKYKVKVKYEADVERVILVEKRSSKTVANNGSTNNDHEDKNVLRVDPSDHVETLAPIVNKENDVEQSRSRTQSQDHVISNALAVNATSTVHTTASSMRMTSNAQPKVDHHRAPSQDREVSVISQSKQQQQQMSSSKKQRSHQRSQSRESPPTVSNMKPNGRKSHREYPRMVVPYVQNGHAVGNTWNQSHTAQPYFSNPMLHQQRTNIYMTPKVPPSQTSQYHQPYPYGQHPSAPFTYHK
jgi:hypothetical protein